MHGYMMHDACDNVKKNSRSNGMKNSTKRTSDCVLYALLSVVVVFCPWHIYIAPQNVIVSSLYHLMKKEVIACFQ